MNSKQFLIVIVAIVAVGVAVIVGVRTLGSAGSVNATVGQKAIEQAVQQAPAQSAVPPPRDAPRGVIMRMPGNKGNR